MKIDNLYMSIIIMALATIFITVVVALWKLLVKNSSKKEVLKVAKVAESLLFWFAIFILIYLTFKYN